MTWNVYLFNINRKQIEVYNALGGYSDFIRKLRRKSANKTEFFKELRLEMQSRYWSRYEYETVIKSFDYIDDRSDERKIDVFEQLDLNWDQFAEYCWKEAGSK